MVIEIDITHNYMIQYQKRFEYLSLSFKKIELFRFRLKLWWHVTWWGLIWINLLIHWLKVCIKIENISHING